MQSDIRKMGIEMSNLENRCVKFIDPCYFYIVKVNFRQAVSRKVAEECLSLKEPKPLCIYHTPFNLFLIFSCVNEGEEHQYNGNHNLIVSKYVCYFLARDPSFNNVSVGIIEFETQNQILTYLMWIVYASSREYLIELSKGKITQNDVNFSTEIELLKKYNLVEVWENSTEKYGLFLRLSKGNIKSMSEYLDARNTSKYINFIFYDK